jgi:hypothetical protein
MVKLNIDPFTIVGLDVSYRMERLIFFFFIFFYELKPLARLAFFEVLSGENRCWTRIFRGFLGRAGPGFYGPGGNPGRAGAEIRIARI